MRPHRARFGEKQQKEFLESMVRFRASLTLAVTKPELTWQKHVFAAIRLSIFSRNVFGPPSGQPRSIDVEPYHR
jgi:hypothetical protein